MDNFTFRCYYQLAETFPRSHWLHSYRRAVERVKF